MTTVTAARTVVRDRIAGGNIKDANNNTVPIRWPNEDKDSVGAGPLPDTPAPFIYCEFSPGRQRLVAIGGGQGQNLYRYEDARLVGLVFVPKDTGTEPGELIGEQVAALFRSYSDGVISCTEASVLPGGDGAALAPPEMASEVGNYFCVPVEVEVAFDQIG